MSVIKAQAGKRERRNARNILRSFMNVANAIPTTPSAESEPVRLYAREVAHTNRARIWR
jgi:hypothetical protein